MDEEDNLMFPFIQNTVVLVPKIYFLHVSLKIIVKIPNTKYTCGKTNYGRRQDPKTNERL